MSCDIFLLCRNLSTILSLAALIVSTSLSMPIPPKFLCPCTILFGRLRALPFIFVRYICLILICSCSISLADMLLYMAGYIICGIITVWTAIFAAVIDIAFFFNVLILFFVLVSIFSNVLPSCIFTSCMVVLPSAFCTLPRCLQKSVALICFNAYTLGSPRPNFPSPLYVVISITSLSGIT